MPKNERQSLQPVLLHADEAAALLGLGRSTVYRLLQSGELPSIRVGRAVRVPRASLARWIAAQTGEPVDLPTRNGNAGGDEPPALREGVA